MEKEFWELLANYGTKIHPDKHVCLNISKDSPSGNSFYLLEEGICALIGITKKGEETVYLYFYPRRIIGFNQLLTSSRKEYPVEFSILTKTPCTLYRICFSVFQNLFKNNPKFNSFLMQTLADNYYEVLVHFQQRMEESAVAGLSRLLLEVAQPRDEVMVVPKFFTYSELAKYLGAHQVTVSRIMARLKQMGYISKDACGIILRKPEAIKALILNDRELNY